MMIAQLFITAVIFTLICNTISLLFLNHRVHKLEKKGER